MNSAKGRCSVIVADDHPIVRDAIQGLLSRGEFTVLASFSNGVDALKGLRELEPDLAVLDLCMPGLTGIGVLKAVEHEGLKTRVILVTASATDEQIVQSVVHGVWGIMLKDAAADDLIDCLRKVSKGERCLPPDLVSSAVANEGERREDAERLQKLLTSREREIAALVAAGHSNKEIARTINITEGT